MDRAGERFASWQEGIAVRREAGLTLFFAPATRNASAPVEVRPDVAAIEAVAAASGATVPFAISHQPQEHPYWVELLALGLTFDLRGLTPGVEAPAALPQHAFGLPRPVPRQFEAMVLRPGPHLSSASALLPVVRTMAALGCELSVLPGLRGIGWEPAGSIMAPDYFRSTVAAWLNDGPFPALGFTALSRLPDGAMRSIGLGFFLGHEVELAARPGETAGDAARQMVRLIHDLVQNGSYAPGDHAGPAGERLHCSFNTDLTLLHVRRDD